MIKHIRSVRVQNGKAGQAAQWGQEVADWLNARWPDTNAQVFREVFGDAGTLYWIGDFEDIATIERRTAEREADPEWRALMQRNVDLFVPGSLHDTLLRSAPIAAAAGEWP